MADKPGAEFCDPLEAALEEYARGENPRRFRRLARRFLRAGRKKDRRRAEQEEREGQERLGG
jgi:hypothetical protein